MSYCRQLYAKYESMFKRDTSQSGWQGLELWTYLRHWLTLTLHAYNHTKSNMILMFSQQSLCLGILYKQVKKALSRSREIMMY